MLYVFYGDDTATASKKIQATIKDLHKKRPDAEFFQVEGRTLTNDFFAQYTASQGLFEQKHIVEVQYPFETAESKEVFLGNLSQMAESDNVFLVIEGKMLAPEKKKIEKHAQKMLEHKKPAAGKPDFNLFSLADAVGGRDKKKAWVIYQKALSMDTAPEEIHGVIWWQMKTIYTTLVTKSASDAGIKDFSYNKSARFAEKYSKSELETILQDLVSMYHDAHLGVTNFELSLEKFVLNI